MKNENLAQGVKELRKRKGLSQEELSENSGLSLRTIQRVENGETEPTGETLKRISNTLDITPRALIDWEIKKESLNNTFKTKNEYCHVYHDKLVISSTPKPNDLVGDFNKSVNNGFKTLMVFFISIPIFTTLSFAMYTLDKPGLAIQSGAFALCFFSVAFYSMLFTSGTPIIKTCDIKKIKLLRILFFNTVVVYYQELGRIKKRGLIIEDSQVDTVIGILKSEKLIKEKDINLNKKKGDNFVFILMISAVIASQIFQPFSGYAKLGAGTIAIIIATTFLTLTMLKKLISAYYSNRKAKQQTTNNDIG